VPMNPRILRPLARPLLLDAVPGAAAAYSLRQLSNAYTGPVVTVRRSSDDAEEDFKASEIDDGTLAAFCGAGDGLVKTWHDQSGSGNDASQGTAASQPKIVSSGSLVLEEGKPAVQFDGTDDYLDCGAVVMPSTGPVSIFAVAAGDADSSGLAIVSQYRLAVTGRCLLGYASTSGGVGYYWFGNGSNPLNLQTYYIENDKNSFISLVMPTQNSGYIYANAANYAEDTATNANRYQINTEISNAVATFSGTISEILIYTADQSANRQLIEGNLAWYY
jgi:hypothetical protein